MLYILGKCKKIPKNDHPQNKGNTFENEVKNLLLGCFKIFICIWVILLFNCLIKVNSVLESPKHPL